MTLKGKKALFVSYNAVSDPVVKSQALPYLSGLASKGVKFTLLTFEKERGCPDDIAARLKKDGIEWIRLVFHSRPIIAAKPFDIAAGFFVTLYQCLFKKIRIVHGRGIMSAAMSILPAKLSGAYFVFDMKSSLAEMYRLSGKIKKGSFYYNALSFLEGLCVRLSDTVIVETEDHRLLLERKLAGRSRRPLVSVLPCCVEVERFRAQEGRRDMDRPTDAITMVYMGSLSGWYMIPEMLDFFKAVKERFKKASLLFLTYDKEGRLARLVKEKGVEGVSVRKADYHEVPAILSSATFGMLFKWPNERLDSFPIKVGEYLASGLPVIINAGMGDVEALIAGHGLGIVVRSLTREGYEKACSEMEPLIRDMGNARKRCACAAADRLSSSFALAQYETVYNNIKR